MNGINSKLYSKLVEIGDEKSEILINLLSLLSEAKTSVETKQVEHKFNLYIDKVINEKE